MGLFPSMEWELPNPDSLISLVRVLPHVANSCLKIQCVQDMPVAAK